MLNYYSPDPLPAVFAQAGIEEHERRWHPEYGWLLSAVGVRKLAAMAPDCERARHVMEQVSQVVCDSIRARGGNV